MSLFLDIIESHVRKGQYLYSVTKDKMYEVKEDDNCGIYFIGQNKLLSIKDRYIELSSYNIGASGYYLVPKYVVKQFMEESLELWV